MAILAAFELDVTIGADRLPPSEITLQIETAAGLQDVELVAGFRPVFIAVYAAIGRRGLALSATERRRNHK